MDGLQRKDVLLKTLSPAKRLDGTLATKEEQYHLLYMLEIDTGAQPVAPDGHGAGAGRR